MGLRLSALAGRLALLSFAFVLTYAAAAPPALCQTAHYSGVVVPLVGGFPFARPGGDAVDAAGDVFVCDVQASELYEIVAVNGSIPANPTVEAVGSGFVSPGGVAVDASGNIYVADSGNSAVKEIEAVNGVIPASPTIITLGSGFGYPTAVAVDAAGDVLVYDASDQSVEEIVAVNGVIPANPVVTTVATAAISYSGIAVDFAGDLFLTDYFHGAVWEITAVNGAIPNNPTLTEVVSGLSGPEGITVDASGDLFVDNGDNQVTEILAVGGTIPSNPTILTQGGGFQSTQGLAVDTAGDVFVADDHTVEEIQLPAANFGTVNVNAAGSIILIPFTFDSAGTLSGWSVLPNQKGANPALDFAEVPASDTCSTSQSYDPGDTCSIAVQFSPHRPGLRTGAVQLLDSGGNVIATAHLKGIGQGPQAAFPSNTTVKTLIAGFLSPYGVAVDSAGDLFVADVWSYDEVQEIEAVNGVIPADPTIRTLGSGFEGPLGVAVDAAGDVFVTEAFYGRVKEIVAVDGAIPANPTILTWNGFAAPYAAAADASGNLFVAEFNSHDIQELLAVNGAIPENPTIREIDLPTSGNLGIGPDGVAVDAQGDVFVSASFWSEAVFEIVAVDGAIPSDPTIVTIPTGLLFPMGVGVDAAGDVYVMDNSDGNVAELLAVNGAIPANPTVLTFAGGTGRPNGLAVDSSGNIFFGDTYSNAIDEISLITSPSLTFPNATALGTTDTTDGPMSVTVANNGNAPLVFPLPGGIGAAVSPRISGANTTNPAVSSNFLWDPSSTCEQTTASSPAPFSLAPGASCTIVIDFAPAAGSAGTVSGSVTLTDDNENVIGATQTIPLSGTAIVTSLTPPLMIPPGGTYSADQQVSISESAPGATIYYTTDGTTPTIHSAVFNSGSPVSVSANTTIKALAVESGLKNSAVATANYVLKVLEPAIGLAAGTYSSTQQASITDGTSNAAIWYTTDGMTPVPGASDATQYGGSPVQITESTELKAVAAVTGWTTSTAASAKYTLKVAEPVIALAAGSYSTPQQAAISDSNASATIWYTTDGMTPVPGASDATQYGGSPVAVPQSFDLKAVAAIPGWTSSTVASAKYTLKAPTPVISLATGSYSSAQQAAISDSNGGAAIWYTTDGMTPVPGASDATQYVSGNPVQISQTTTLKAVAAVTGWTTSVPASASYTFKVPTPTFSLAAGTYSSPQSTMISDADGGATIWYTTDGSTPVPGASDATQYAGGVIAINATTKLKAVAAESGWTTSAAAAASYTIK